VTAVRERRSGEVAIATDVAPRRAHQPTLSVAVHARPTRVRVLVVDDDEIIRLLIAANLTLEGFDVTTAVDGQDCVDKVMAIAPDIITLDVTMPRLDGWETAIRLRQCPDTSSIKLVLITARGVEGDQARPRQVGADAYLTKPFDVGEMIRVIRKLAGARRQCSAEPSYGADPRNSPPSAAYGVGVVGGGDRIHSRQRWRG
jgi:CheY-like chemotaxis protein